MILINLSPYKTRRQKMSRWLLGAAMVISLSFLGCSREAFVVAPNQQVQKAPGSVMVPPKVDILLAEDDTGSMSAIYSQVAQQLPAFLNTLQSNQWDYHFAVTPLVTPRAFNQIVTSQYDSNWGASWIPPYPGAAAGGPGTIPSNLFSTPTSFTGFLTSSDISSFANGSEPGLDNILHAINTYAPGTNFIRQDALFVVLSIGNGNDTSGVTFCYKSGAQPMPCEQAGPWSQDANGNQFYKRYPDQALIGCTPAKGYPEASCAQVMTGTSSLQSRMLAMTSLKPAASAVQFYAATSATAHNNGGCMGGNSFAGTRYQQMAGLMGGTWVDVCTTPVSTLLSQIATNLQAQRLNFRTKFLFIANEPDQTTIVVTRIPGDGSAQSTIPHDSANGWTYAGHITDYAIDFPIPMNLQTGYAIELHGTAKLVGNDTASVQYTPLGLQNSAAH